MQARCPAKTTLCCLLLTQVMAAGMLALCQTCKWLGSNSTEQARKLAKSFGTIAKTAGDGDDQKGDSSDDDDDKGQDEGAALQEAEDQEAAAGVLQLLLFH